MPEQCSPLCPNFFQRISYLYTISDWCSSERIHLVIPSIFLNTIIEHDFIYSLNILLASTVIIRIGIELTHVYSILFIWRVERNPIRTMYKRVNVQNIATVNKNWAKTNRLRRIKDATVLELHTVSHKFITKENFTAGKVRLKYLREMITVFRVVRIVMREEIKYRVLARRRTIIKKKKNEYH